MDEIQCRDVSEFVGVLANAYRIRILCCLSGGERSVGEIASRVGLSAAHVSSHLRVLYDRGYVARRRDWKLVYYGLRDPRVRDLLDVAAGLAPPTDREHPPAVSRRYE